MSNKTEKPAKAQKKKSSKPLSKTPKSLPPRNKKGWFIKKKPVKKNTARKTITLRQKNLAKLIVENSLGKNKLNQKQMLVKVGYSEHISHQPKRILQSKGVRRALKNLKFDNDSAKKVCLDVMRNSLDDGHRMLAVKEMFKVGDAYPSTKVDLRVKEDDYNEKTDEELYAIIEQRKH